MKQSVVLRRVVDTAEQWGRQRRGAPMTAEAVREPSCGEDGSLQATVEMQPRGEQSNRVRGLVTLESNGTLACFAPDELV